MTADLIAFYRGVGSDSAGRTLEEILAWDFIRLEIVHDFIQWLFPLPEPSEFNDEAPLLTPEQIQLFRTEPLLGENLVRSFERMLGFYGFTLRREPSRRIDESDLFGHRRHVLYGGFNHNHLRITRILRSLTLLGDAELARLFFERLEASDREQTLPGESLRYWEQCFRLSKPDRCVSPQIPSPAICTRATPARSASEGARSFCLANSKR